MKIVNEPEGYWDWISPLPDDIISTASQGWISFYLFVTSRKKYETEVLKLRDKLKPDGMIWISVLRKPRKVETDLDENIVRDFFCFWRINLDIKVCAVSEVGVDWSW